MSDVIRVVDDEGGVRMMGAIDVAAVLADRAALRASVTELELVRGTLKAEAIKYAKEAGALKADNLVLRHDLRQMSESYQEALDELKELREHEPVAGGNRTWRYEAEQGNALANICEYEGTRCIRFVCEFADPPSAEDAALMIAAKNAPVPAQDDARDAHNETTENLVALVGRLSYALRKANPANGLPAKALSFLESTGHKFHIARSGEPEVCSVSAFETAVRELEITSAGHAVGADKSGDRYQVGFAKGFHECWKQFSILAAKGEGK